MDILSRQLLLESQRGAPQQRSSTRWSLSTEARNSSGVRNSLSVRAPARPPLSPFVTALQFFESGSDQFLDLGRFVDHERAPRR